MKIRTSQYAELLEVSMSTIYQWLKIGKVEEPERTFGNHRRFEIETNKNRSNVIYSRVSSAGQKEDSFEANLVADLMSIIASFSGSIYGSCYKNKELTCISQ